MRDGLGGAGVEDAHQLWASADGSDRQAAADQLAEDDEVRDDPVGLLHPPAREAKGDHLVEDQRDPAAGGLLAHEPSEAGLDGAQAGAVGHQVEQHAREALAVALERVEERGLLADRGR